jgi:hypothetical protein
MERGFPSARELMRHRPRIPATALVLDLLRAPAYLARVRAVSARRRRRRLGVALLLLAALFPALRGRARAEDPPPQDSLAALAADAARAVEEVRARAAALGLAEDDVRPAGACASLPAAASACSAVGLAPCEDALARLYGRLRGLAATLDPVRAGLAEYTAAAVGGLANRLAVARDALAAGRCRHLAMPGAHPSRLVLDLDGRTIVVEPLTPLRAGRRWALVVDGLDEPALASARASVAPRSAGDGSIVVPPGAFADRVAGAAEPADGLRAADAVAFLRRLEQDVTGLAGLAPFSGVQLTLPSPLTEAQLATVRAAFVPAGGAPAAATVAVFRTYDARPALVAYRDAVARAGCSERPLTPVEVERVGSALHGEYRSLEIRGETGLARTLGVAASAAPVVTRPFLLALPRTMDGPVPLVVAVHGHGSRASEMLAAHAAGVTSRGMALMALDLPEHGERAVEGRVFLDALVPSLLAVNVRQAVVDVMGAVHAARVCGLVLPDGRRFTASDVRYLGYSLGGIVGAVARSVEPGLGPTALLAPAGDLTTWMMLRIGLGLGSGFVSCIGGADNGRNCQHGAGCAPPGVCEQDPALGRLAAATQLPYRLVLAGSDPLSVAGQPGGDGSEAPLLVVTGGRDEVLLPLLATRLADAYRLHPSGAHRRRRRQVTLVQWPDLGHDLGMRKRPDEQAYVFLADAGRGVRRVAPVDSVGPPR